MKLQKDTVLSLVKGATVFINYLGGCMFYGLPFHVHIDLLFADTSAFSRYVCLLYYVQTRRVAFY